MAEPVKSPRWPWSQPGSMGWIEVAAPLPRGYPGPTEPQVPPDGRALLNDLLNKIIEGAEKGMSPRDVADANGLPRDVVDHAFLLFADTIHDEIVRRRAARPKP